MINLWKIEEAKNKLIKEFNPKKIYVFGSYAWGSPTEDSDLDLMIITKDCGNKINEMRRGIRALRGIGFSKDIIVESEHEFFENSKDINKIENEIYNRGYLIYENAN
ncbi:nucleotidyltransferase domain-containing protein [uncultured Ilyobacter sp.]|uniref:nucleotidyltransferase domain-containing protein n=1 Tax=uncultured Ilyobacter sp. TaxID=544433 RepID=UPI0029C0D284|nr:nucleotidyltransferase domain-containing protein [uncultured Ilyobacter sp.]